MDLIALPNRLLLLVLVICANCFHTDSSAQSSLEVSGEVTKPLSLTVADVAAWPSETITVKDRDVPEHSYKGIKLSRLLEAAGVTLGPDLRGENLVKYVLVAASDGYEVIYSLPEVDPEFTAGGIYVVYEADGKPLPADTGPFRMVVPDDKKHARWIRQIVSIKVLFPKQ
jgi:DMSO/TMAO reductase YedYZ molybdopterin-dependent catalytic subunit